MLNKGEQRGVQLSILQLMSVGGDCDNILRPYLCYAFAPKCRKKYDHGILPCKSACKAVRVSYVSGIAVAVLRRNDIPCQC